MGAPAIFDLAEARDHEGDHPAEDEQADDQKAQPYAEFMNEPSIESSSDMPAENRTGRRIAHQASHATPVQRSFEQVVLVASRSSYSSSQPEG